MIIVQIGKKYIVKLYNVFKAIFLLLRFALDLNNIRFVNRTN